MILWTSPPHTQVVWQGDYSPFGTVDVIVNNLENRFRFPGQYFDSESGLYYNWHRFYDPETGRYVSADPIGLEGGINLYGYVYQDPINWIDPKGLDGGAITAPAVIGGSAIVTAWLASPDGKKARDALGDGIKGHWNKICFKAKIAWVFLNSIGQAIKMEETSEPCDDECDSTEEENTNPYTGPVDKPVIVVDSKGNAIPVDEGQQIKTSPDGKWVDVKDSDGKSTGTQIHGPHKPTTHSDAPEALVPHAHRPGTRKHWLPIH